MNWLIATDLDGTLLDDDYPDATAAAVIDKLSAKYADACIALVSSKTPLEMIELVSHCQSSPLLIFENGSGLAWREPALCGSGTSRAKGFEIDCTGQSYADIVTLLHELRQSEGYAFRGFADMSVDEVAAHTGLSFTAAARSKQRLSTEPIHWQGSETELLSLQSTLAEHGLHIVRGGRFHHVGSNVDKGRALTSLWRRLRFQYGTRPRIVACGDAPNDLPMMERADHAIVFPLREGGYMQPRNPNTTHASQPGPGPWLAAVTELLDIHYQEATFT
ncbi:MAG: HAD-IIB family hydrolase [Pseudomonadota bacterium]